MGKKLRKKVLAGVLASMMLVGIAPTKVFAAEDVVSKEKLEIIVQEEVNKLDFNNLGIDKVIEGINGTITDTVTGTVQGILTPENIKVMVAPIIKGLVNEALKDVKLPPQVDINKIIDDVIASQVVDKILTNQFTQEVLERTIQYAVADIMDIVGIPTVGEVIETSKEELTVSVIESVWNAELIDKEYKVPIVGTVIKFQVSPYQNWTLSYKRPNLTVTPTGWNSDAIKGKIQLDLLKVVGANTQVPDLSSIDYETIVKNAAKRAVTDIINEKIIEVKATINTVIQKKVDELRVQAEQAIKDALNSIKNKFPSWGRK
ncbi:hypothetical protein ABFP60_07930 [Clostridioides difficile]